MLKCELVLYTDSSCFFTFVFHDREEFLRKCLICCCCLFAGVFLFSVRIEPTFDQNSAYRHIRLSNANRKATLCAENQNYPETPERFMYWRQVMCVETLAGSPYYWEMEWTGQRVLKL